MSQFIDFTLPSTVPGRTLHGFRCVPEGQVRAVLQLSHGMVEFIDRYKPLAENLAGYVYEYPEDPTIIKTVEEPFSKTGGVAVPKR